MEGGKHSVTAKQVELAPQGRGYTSEAMILPVVLPQPFFFPGLNRYT